MENAKEPKRISIEELQRRMDGTGELYLIDTLPGDHFEKIHLPGALNACVFQVDFPQQIAEIVQERDADLVVYGAGGSSMDALTAADKLLRLGYPSVFVFSGGIAEWHAAGLSLEGENPASGLISETVFHFQDGDYTLDAGKSIEWKGRNANGAHHGAVDLARGQITVKGDAIQGTFEVDMHTIRNINLEGDPLQPVLVDHLKSDDFFFVKMFPKATFIIEKATPLEGASLTTFNYNIEGRLEIRGVQNRLCFPAAVNPLADGGFSAEAHFDIDRTKWGVICGSSGLYKHLGMHKVYDLISFQLNLVFQ